MSQNVGESQTAVAGRTLAMSVTSQDHAAQTKKIDNKKTNSYKEPVRFTPVIVKD